MPTLLTGYGAYGLSLNPVFSSNRISLLDRGVAFAIAHVRGGGELGKSWHDSGRMLNKENSFSDFVAVAEQLIHEGFTSSDRLAIQGGSAGGLLVGAVVNRRPELFCAAVLVVPFVDIINTILDESLPLTIGEFEEWGNPKNKDEFEYMRRYCPYSNLAQMKYPEMLVRASLHDSQVMYWEPAKYVARMRNLNRNGSQILLQTNMKAGHGGSSGRYDYLREVGFDYAYILWRLGVESGSSKT
jgi:oligopeptidase B